MAVTLDTYIDISNTGTDWETTDLDPYINSGDDAEVAIIRMYPKTVSASYIGMRPTGDSVSTYWSRTGDWGMSIMYVKIGENNQIDIRATNTTTEMYFIGYLTSVECTATTDYTDITSLVTTESNWTALDLSAYIPDDTVFVILQWRRQSTATPGPQNGIRQNGSSDSFTQWTWTSGCIMGVDEDNKVEYYSNNLTDMDVHLVGYITSGVAYENGIDLALPTTGSWQNIDVGTVDTPPSNAECVLIKVNTGSSGYGFRETNDSTDYAIGSPGGTTTFPVTLDSNNTFDYEIANVNQNMYVLGYLGTEASLTQTAETTLTKPCIIAENIIEASAATITATNTDADSMFDVVNLGDRRTYTYWKALNTTTDPIFITIDYGSATTADAIGIGSHNLNTIGATVELQCSTDNFVLNVTSLSTFTPSDDTHLAKHFTSISRQYWRLRISGSSAVPTIGMIVLGDRLDMEVYINGGTDPAPETIKATSQTSTRGNLLGSLIKYTSYDMNIPFKNLTTTWVQDTFKPYWDANIATLVPFFFVWDFTNHPNDVYFVKVVDNTKLVMPYSPLYRSLTLRMKGLKE